MLIRLRLTVLVEKHNIATRQIDGMSSAQAGHCGVLADPPWLLRRRNEHTASADNNDSLRHGEWLCGKGENAEEGKKRGESGRRRAETGSLYGAVMTASMHTPLGLREQA